MLLYPVSPRKPIRRPDEGIGPYGNTVQKIDTENRRTPFRFTAPGGTSKRGAAAPLCLVGFKERGFSRGEGNRNPSPLERHFPAFFAVEKGGRPAGRNPPARAEPLPYGLSLRQNLRFCHLPHQREAQAGGHRPPLRRITKQYPCRNSKNIHRCVHTCGCFQPLNFRLSITASSSQRLLYSFSAWPLTQWRLTLW